MSCVQIRCLRWLLSVPGLRLRLVAARTLLRWFFGSERWLRFWRRLHSKFNERRIMKGETWVVYRTSIVYFFSLYSLRKRVKHEWRQLKVSRISSILSIFGRTGSIPGVQKCRADCQRDKWTLHVSITVHKANVIKQMSQTRTPGQSKSCFGK